MVYSSVFSHIVQFGPISKLVYAKAETSLAYDTTKLAYSHYRALATSTRIFETIHKFSAIIENGQNSSIK